MEVKRVDIDKIQVLTNSNEVEELFNMFFGKFYNLKDVYSNTVEYHSEVLKKVLDCNYLSDCELASILSYFFNCTKMDLKKLYTKRYLGVKRLNKIIELKQNIFVTLL